MASTLGIDPLLLLLKLNIELLRLRVMVKEDPASERLLGFQSLERVYVGGTKRSSDTGRGDSDRMEREFELWKVGNS